MSKSQSYDIESVHLQSAFHLASNRLNFINIVDFSSLTDQSADSSLTFMHIHAALCNPEHVNEGRPFI